MRFFMTSKSEKSISVFSVLLIAIALAILLSMTFILKLVADRSEELDKLENDRGYAENCISELSNASDYLTTEVWTYATSGDMSHMLNYWREVESVRTRDKALEKLLHTHLTAEEKTHVMRAKAYSDNMIAGETWSMRMIAESYGVPEDQMPDQVRHTLLSPYEKSMAPAEKRNRAMAYLFGPEYAESKHMIRRMVIAFNGDLSKRLDQETSAMLEANRGANHYSVVVVILLMALMAILVVVYTRLMGNKNKELELAAAKAEAASNAKSYFTSRMSHEIRTPLNAVLGYLHIAEHAQDISTQSSSLAKCRIAALNLLHIVNDVLDLSTIENGKLELVHEVFSVSSLIQDWQIVYSALAADKHIDFQMDVSPLVRDSLMGDRMRTNQILTNLMSNALKFTPTDGSITVKVSQEIHGDNAVMTYSVADTGIGMSEEFLPHIFDAYEQENTSIHQ